MIDDLLLGINKIKDFIKKNNINRREGLPEPLFIFATSLMPIVNVDLFITRIVHDKREILFTWRDDLYHGKGWHIPGGIVRLKEHLVERVKKNAIEELGAKVEFDTQPILVKEWIVSEPRPWLDDEFERCHNIAFLYHCKLPSTYTINNWGKSEHEKGFKKWFDKIPDDLLKIHRELYSEIFESWFGGII